MEFVLTKESGMGDWVKRDALVDEPLERDGLTYLWLKAAAHSKQSKAEGANRDASPEELEYWKEHRLLVEMLLREATTEVCCDPDRSAYEPGRPAVIWAFACTSGDVVHQVVVKRNIVRDVGQDFAAELVRDLLGERLNRSCRFTHPIRELQNGRWGVRIPVDTNDRPIWHGDSTWLARHMLFRAQRGWLEGALDRARSDAWGKTG